MTMLGQNRAYSRQAVRVVVQGVGLKYMAVNGSADEKALLRAVENPEKK